VTERVLKRLALHAIRAFETEVKDGIRKGLSADECADALPTTEEDGEKPHAKKQKRSTGRAVGVKQAKIVRQQDRVDPITAKGRSKGYGFVEMHKHSDALRVLRWANCNSVVGPLFEQWYKEELEDLLKVEKLKDQNERNDARIERFKEEFGKGPLFKGGVALIVEFSIENVQVVRRRNAKQDGSSRRQVSDPRNLFYLL
jgi:nucleolar protein 4